MTKKKTPDAPDPNLEAVRKTLAAAGRTPEPRGRGGRHEPPGPLPGMPQAADPDVVEAEVMAWCAGLDQSDTDNARRLLAHFGRDLLVMSQEKARANLFVVWAGTHWNTATGGPGALALAQRLGDRILAEAPLLALSEAEAKATAAAEAARKKGEDDRGEGDRAAIRRAESIGMAMGKRRKARKDFAVTSKNRARLDNMLTCAAPHILIQPDAFNADPLKVATAAHTLHFSAFEEQELNPEMEREDTPPDTPEFIAVKASKVTAHRGHSRRDLITELCPPHYDPAAQCPRWTAFMAEFMPDDEVRHMVQVSAGLGLLGLTEQRLFFHYGNGANGKSVFLEVICRVLGEAAVTLPSTSFSGGAGQSGGATPDIARLHGRRFLRVKEMPEGEDLREDLVKELTGGEDIAVRDLFQGYFDFRPIFTGHMSGNGYPKILGTDEGIWRRMAVILWPKTIPEHMRRNFAEVVASFEPEHSGILNWLIAGALAYLREGLIIPAAVAAETQKFRDEMDPTSAFCARHVVLDVEREVTAREFYTAYLAWAGTAAVRPISETRFGKIMAKKYQRIEGRVRKYAGVTLVDVPEAAPGPGEFPPGYGG